MPNWGYSDESLFGERVKASGRDLDISSKAAREICNEIRHMRLEAAIMFLQEVIDKEKPVPYRRHKKRVSHRAGLDGWYAGRFPVKAAKKVLTVLTSLEANCVDQGLDVERVKIVHAVSQRGRMVRKYIPRAFGRSSPYHKRLCHIELMAEEDRG